MERLRELCKDIDVQLDDIALERFEKYMNLVIEWNEKINLTAITDRQEFIVKHFYDSILLLLCADIKKGAKVIDVGTGAGFPGIPLKIVRPDIQLTLLDSLNKRIVFISDVVMPGIGLNAEAVHGRAEDFSKQAKYREKYDFAVSRAVANLSALSEYCIPFVKKGGEFISMKGPDVHEELSSAQNAVQVLGGEVSEVKNLTLPDNGGRSIVIIKKVKNTPEKYPRRGVKINKNPL